MDTILQVGIRLFVTQFWNVFKSINKKKGVVEIIFVKVPVSTYLNFYGTPLGKSMWNIPRFALSESKTLRKNGTEVTRRRARADIIIIILFIINYDLWSRFAVFSRTLHP